MNKYRQYLILILLLVSLVNPTTLAVALVLISVYYCWTDGWAGAIKALILITLRCILNPGIAAVQDSISMIKWALLFGLSLFAVLTKPPGPRKSANDFVLMLLFFSAYLIGSSFLTGSYPVVSAFKVISWAVIFGAVYFTIGDDSATDWIELLRHLLSVMMVVSVVTLPLDVGYLVNGRGFQGIMNHPNLLGILSALCFVLNMSGVRKLDWKRAALLALCFVLCFLSQSRTGLFSILIMLAYAVMNSNLGTRDKVWAFLGLGVLAAAAVALYRINDPYRTGTVSRFLYKGYTDDILYSRDSQIESLAERFLADPILGNGFMTPYSPNIRNFNLSFDIAMEPGNLVMALLAFSGLIGLLLFALTFGCLFRYVPREKRILFFIPMILSLGEMAFFSSNGIAIVYYVIYSACYSPELYEKEKKGNRK